MSERARLQTGGAVEESRLYIPRRADQRLVELLEDGRWCNIFSSRQVGKSSLRQRAMSALRLRGRRVISIDFQGMGGEDTAGWYDSLHRRLARAHGRTDPGIRLPGPEALREQLRDQLLPADDRPLVLFFDEVDVPRERGVDTSGFFGMLRSLVDARNEEPIWRRLTVCLVGVSSLSDLVGASAHPYNASEDIELTDFSPREASALLPYLEGLGPPAAELLDAVLDWTHGHPFLTLKLVSRVIEAPELPQGARAAVHEVVMRFLEVELADHPVLYAVDQYRERLGRYDAQRRNDGDAASSREVSALELYRRLLAEGPQPIPRDQREARAHGDLVLMGLGARRAGPGSRAQLEERCRLMRTAFDEEWVRQRIGHRRYSEQVEAWERSGRTQELLPRGPELTEAQVWLRSEAAPSNAQISYVLAAGQEEQAAEKASHARTAQALEEEQDRKRKIMYLMILLAVLLGVTLVQSLKIAQQQELAQRQAAELAAVARKLELSEARVAALDLQLATKDAEIHKKRDLVDQKTEELREAQQRWVEEQHGSESKRRQALLEYSRKQVELTEALQQLAQLQADREITNGQLTQAERQLVAVNEELQQTRGRVEHQDETIASLQSRNENAAIALSSAEQRIEELQAELGALEERQRELQRQLGEQQRRTDAAEGALDRLCDQALHYGEGVPAACLPSRRASSGDAPAQRSAPQ